MSTSKHVKISPTIHTSLLLRKIFLRRVTALESEGPRRRRYVITAPYNNVYYNVRLSLSLVRLLYNARIEYKRQKAIKESETEGGEPIYVCALGPRSQ